MAAFCSHVGHMCCLTCQSVSEGEEVTAQWEQIRTTSAENTRSVSKDHLSAKKEERPEAAFNWATQSVRRKLSMSPIITFFNGRLEKERDWRAEVTSEEKVKSIDNISVYNRTELDSNCWKYEQNKQCTQAFIKPCWFSACSYACVLFAILVICVDFNF